MPDSSILFVPGIGMPPQVFGAARWALRCPSAIWQRPGYRSTETVIGFDAQVDELATTIDELRPAVVVGISGGATLALAVALRQAGPLRVIAHEPFVGCLVPELDEAIRRRATALGTDPDLGQIVDFLDEIYGEQHRLRFPPEWLDRNAITIADELRAIPEFQPTSAELSSIGCSVLATVGARSPAVRHDVSERLADAGVETRVVPGAGHLLPMEQPDALVRLITAELDRLEGATSNAA